MVHDSNHSLVAITPQINRPGLLSELLGQFHFYGMDIAKIHSRPAIDAVDLSEEPQMFYLEVKCAPSAESLVRCADAIGYKFEVASQPEKMFRILGGFRI
jgi:prephenate dehydratase